MPDLSVLEAEQDRHLPVSSTESETDDMLSAARRIKDAWRAKNDPQRSKLSSFRFGGSHPEATPQIDTVEIAPLPEITQAPIPPNDSAYTSTTTYHNNLYRCTFCAPCACDRAALGGSSTK